MLETVAVWCRAPRPDGIRGTRRAVAARVRRLIAPAALATAIALAPVAAPAGASVVGEPATASGGTANGVTATLVDDETGPLTLTIDEVTPDTLITRAGATVTLSGTVTNTSDEAWSTVRVYPVVSSTPITSADELSAAAASPDDTFIGNRITDEGVFDNSINRLEPGATQRFTIVLPAEDLDIDGAPGVYWLGVHALGETSEGRSSNAAGKARTFLPILPAGTTTAPVPTSMVVPIREAASFTPEGAIADTDTWTDLFSTGGRLREIVDLAGSDEGGAASWLLDPALLDVAFRLAEGNPERDLGPAEASDPDEPDPSDSTDPGDGDSEAPSDDVTGIPPLGEGGATPDVADGREAEIAAAWLADALAALEDADLYVLPYGDIDLEGTAETDPGLYGVARALSRDTLERYGLSGSPAVAPPDEGVSSAVLDLLDDEIVFVADDHVPDATGSTLPGGEVVASADGRTIVLADSSAASGGPGPGDVRSALQIRQRVVSETVIDDLVASTPTARVVMLPALWDPAGGQLPLTASTIGVDAEPLAQVRPESPGAVAADLITQGPPDQVTPARNVRAARTLLQDGQRLDRVLPDTDTVAPQVAREAMVNVSYADRDDITTARNACEAGSEAINGLLDEISVEVPQGITLASENGVFSARVINGLEQPIEVVLSGQGADDGVTITTTDPITLPAGASATVLVEAEVEKVGVHDVEFHVTDTDGVPLGEGTTVPIRSAAVSDVIWIVIGAAGLILVGATTLWVRRRRAGERAEEASDDAPDAPGAADGEPGEPTGAGAAADPRADV